MLFLTIAGPLLALAFLLLMQQFESWMLDGNPNSRPRARNAERPKASA
jgi:hypothetical protein